MNISTVIDFLEGVKEQNGDLKLESITGFWVHTIPRTGEKIVVPSVGDGLSIKEYILTSTRRI